MGDVWGQGTGAKEKGTSLTTGMHNIISEFPSLPEDISHDSENGWNLEIPFPPLSKTETKSKKPGGVHGTSPRDGDKMPWSLQLNHLL